MAAGNPNNLLDVNISAGQVLSGVIGIEVPGQNGEVDNSGSISGLGISILGAPLSGGTNGVQLDAGGTVVNNAGASISGVNNGIDVRAGTGTVNNPGTTTGTGIQGIGVNLELGGAVGNAASGVISGTSAGVQMGTGAPGSVTNLGSISGTGSNGIGVDLLDGGTLVNAGTISGAGGVAVNFGGPGGSRLVLDPGQVLNGVAHASGTGNVLELAAGPTGGVLSDIGTTLQNFGSTVVDPLANFTITGGVTTPGTISLGDGSALSIGGAVAAGVDVDLSGANAKLTLNDAPDFQGTISNLGIGDVLDLGGLGANATVTLNPAGTALLVTSGAGVTSTIPVTLAAGLDPATVSIGFGNDGNGGLVATVGGGTGTATGGGGTGSGATGAGGTGSGGAGTGTTGTGGSGSGTGGSTGGAGSGTGGGTNSPPTIGDGTAPGGAAQGGSGGSGPGLVIAPQVGGTPTNTSTPTVSGTAVPGSLVTLLDSDGKTVIGTGSADPNSGAFSITSSPLSDGLHTLTATDTVNGQTSAPSSGLQFDIDTHGPSIAFDPGVTLQGRTTAILTGRVSDISGISGVEVYAGDTDIGTATVNPDGTWSITDNPGRGFQTGLHAIATDGAGNTTSAPSNYDLTFGVRGQPYTAVQDRYDPTTGDFLGETFFRRNGVELYENTEQQLANGDLRFTYQGGSFFNSKNYNAFQDTYSPDGDILSHTTNNNDGTHTTIGEANGQVLESFGYDTLTGGGSHETFVFHPGLGQELVTDFKPDGPGHDVVELVHTRLHSLADVLRHTTMSGGDAVIHLGPDTAITLAGVSEAELNNHPSDFKFHA